jgi:glycosyltransferase involved in cell wall biosynthesis
MKLLVLSHELPPVGGGGGRAAYDICHELAKRGHEITILTAHMENLPREETLDGFHILRISSLRKESYRASLSALLGYVLAGLWHGFRFIRIHKPDVIHAHFAVPAGGLAYLLSMLTGTPYILTAHVGDVPGGVPEKTDKWFRWIKPFTRGIWKHARAAVAVSEYTRQLALKHYPVPIKVIPNGVDLSQLASSEIRINNPVQIVFAGRLMPQKNPLAIVQVLSELKQLHWHCSILGDGPLLDDVQHEIIKNNLQDRFTLTGWITPPQVLEKFSKSDVLFMPSLSEGLPVVGVQALAMGLALVVSDIGGFVDLVDENNNGHLVKVQDTNGFVQALRKLITNPSTLLQFRRLSMQKAKQFDIVHVVDEYEAILR